MDHYSQISRLQEAVDDNIRYREIRVSLNDPSPDLDAELAEIDQELAEARATIERLEAELVLYQDGYEAGNEHYMHDGPVPDAYHAADGFFRRGFDQAGQDS